MAIRIDIYILYCIVLLKGVKRDTQEKVMRPLKPNFGPCTENFYSLHLPASCGRRKAGISEAGMGGGGKRGKACGGRQEAQECLYKQVQDRTNCESR